MWGKTLSVIDAKPIASLIVEERTVLLLEAIDKKVASIKAHLNQV